jgi:hypothetical protein
MGRLHAHCGRASHSRASQHSAAEGETDAGFGSHLATFVRLDSLSVVKAVTAVLIPLLQKS